jgi:hypothetical protein
MKQCNRLPIADSARKGLCGRMIETDSSHSNSHASEPESGAPTEEIRERAERLQEKIGDLSKTFDHIERTLAEAAEDSEEGQSKKD